MTDNTVIDETLILREVYKNQRERENSIIYESSGVRLTYVPMGLKDGNVKLILLVHVNEQLISCSISKNTITHRKHAFRFACQNIRGWHKLEWESFAPEEIKDKEIGAFIKEYL